ncbi:MAG: PcfB family protein [Candidatus Fimivivens sp.]
MDVLDGYEKHTVRVGVKVARLSSKVIAKGIMWLLKVLKNKVFPPNPIGKTSIKQLMKKGDKLISQDIKIPELKVLSKTLKRYNIGFSVIQHEGTENYTLFFKAKDEAQLSVGLDAYIAKTVSQDNLEQEQPEIDKSDPDLSEPEISDNESFLLPEDMMFFKSKDDMLYDTPEQNQPEISEPTRDKDIPEDVSFTAAKQKEEPKAKQPKPRSIPKELEEAKAVSKAMQQTRDVQKQHTRQRTKGHER